MTLNLTPVSLVADAYAVWDCRMIDLPLSDELCASGQRERAPID